MSFALLIATVSFFPGQAKLFSKAVRGMTVLYVPHILLVGSMVFWMTRVLRRKSGRLNEVTTAGRSATMIVSRAAPVKGVQAPAA